MTDSRPPLPFTPVRTQKASEAIYQQIYQSILSGCIRPGERLPSERQLIELFQRSRPTVREALRMLERSGIIASSAGSRGAVVTMLSNQSIEQPLQAMLAMGSVSPHDLHEYRAINERALYAWAAERRTDEDLRRLRQLLEQMDGCLDRLPALFERHSEFHFALAEAGKNRLAAIVNNVLYHLISDSLLAGYQRIPAQGRREACEQLVGMHREICAAIERRDASAAERLAADHLHEYERNIGPRETETAHSD